METTPNPEPHTESHGNLLITSLTNEAMPLIRFDSGDSAQIEFNGTCRCGRASPFLNKIWGREVDFITLSSGKRVSPYLFTTLIETDPRIRKYQIVHTGPDSLRIDVVQFKNNNANNDFTKLANKVAEALPNPVEVEIHPVDQIPRSTNGKCQIVRKEFSEPNLGSVG